MCDHSGYDDFASIYNRYWGRFALGIMPVLEQLALNDYPQGTTILDLCCGTGQLAGELTNRGYQVTGVDASRQMLAQARVNAPSATFHLADARRFELSTPFDIALSTFDSLNHLLTLDDLELVFRNVHRQLGSGGIFVFDMNLDSGFRSRWAGSFNIWSDDIVVVTESKYDESERLATISITIFAQNKRDKSLWRRNDLRLTQRAYTVDEIVTALATAGFTEIGVFDAVEDFALRQEGRAFFRAKKP